MEWRRRSRSRSGAAGLIAFYGFCAARLAGALVVALAQGLAVGVIGGALIAFEGVVFDLAASPCRSAPLVAQVPDQRRDDGHEVELADEHLEHRQRLAARRARAVRSPNQVVVAS